MTVKQHAKNIGSIAIFLLVLGLVAAVVRSFIVSVILGP